MKRLDLAFFNPFRNHEAIKLKQADTLSWDDFKKVWLQDYKIYRGVSRNDQKEENPDLWAKLLNSDAYFTLLIGLCQALQKSDYDQEKLESNIGIAHYINPAVVLSLLFISLSIGLNNAANKNEHNHPKLSSACKGLSYGLFYTVGVPLMIVGFLSQVVFTAFHTLISAIMATCSAPFNYLGKVDKSVFKDYASTAEEDNPLISPLTSSCT